MKALNITIRDTVKWDIATLESLLADQWNLGASSSGYSKEVCAHIYALGILAISNELHTIVIGNTIAGFTGIEIPDGTDKAFTGYQGEFETQLANHNKLASYYTAYTYNESPIKSDCELSILILDKIHRGKGIGALALNHVFSRAIELGRHTMVINTDTSCTYSVYERAGCIKVADYPTPGEHEPNSDRTMQFIKSLHPHNGCSSPINR